MSFKKFNATRLFVYTEPHVADPAFTVPVIETSTNNPEPIYHNNEAILVELANKIRDKRMRDGGFEEGVARVLTLFDIPRDEYYKKLGIVSTPKTTFGAMHTGVDYEEKQAFKTDHLPEGAH